MTEQTLFKSSANQAPPVLKSGKPVNTNSLVKAAESLEKRIEFCRQPRQENTRKRRQEAEHFNREADRLEKRSTAIRNLVQQIEDGNVHPSLVGIRNRAQVDLLFAWDKLPMPSDPDDWKHEPLRKFYALGFTTDADYLPARAEFMKLAEVQIPEEEKKRRAIVEVRREIAGIKIDGFFRSPRPVAEAIVDAANLGGGQWVLEPSAGDGAIAEVIAERLFDARTLHVCEINYRLRQILEFQGFNVIAEDFLTVTSKFDRIIGNPPFERMQDVDHVRHAYDLLHEGGRLVMIMSPSPFFNGNRKGAEFREWFNEVGGEVYDLPAGAFKESGTGVNTKYVVIDK